MRSDVTFLFGSLLVSILLIVASKPKVATPSVYVEKSIGIINKTFQEDLKQFSERSIAFHDAVEGFATSEVTESTLQKEYRSLRDAFKKVEFILEYVDKDASDKTLNGAPLPKLEPKVSDLRILEPKGLQVLDELMGSENLSENNTELQEMTKTFQHDVHAFEVYLQNRKITDRQFFEASRQAIVRLATLGITGFDTPGTFQGIQDATTVLQTLQTYFSYYKPELKNVHGTHLEKTIKKEFALGIKETKASNFEDFNRLTFIKNVINPLYKSIKEIHLALDYETIDQVSNYPLAVNYNADNLFAPDFLNSFYYASIANDSTFTAIADLGKLLFYDPVLSGNNEMACASCHAPEKAFTDGQTTSLSNTGKPMLRNSMTLNYSVYASGYFYDLRANRLEDQFEHVILSQDEFNSDYQNIVTKLATSPTYTALFKEAFPKQKQTIKFNNIDYALTAYIMQLNTFDNPVDQYFQGKIDTLPDDVSRGFNLFAGKAACASCHFMPLYSGNVPPLYMDSESEILGVPKHKDTPLVLDDDLGRVENGRTQEIAPFFEASFKTITLRNIEKTAPYMHNGVFDTLEEVMDFYNEGGGAGRGIPLAYQTLASTPLNLTAQEIKDIIAFLNALSDETTVTVPANVPRDFDNPMLNERAFLN